MTSSRPLRIVLLVTAALAVVALLLRAQATGAPIMGSDEYAFHALARFPGVDLSLLDPWLQRVDNRLTFALLHAWSRLEGGGSGVAVTRLVHVVEWVLVSGVLYQAFRGVITDSARGLGALATLLLPSAFYTLIIMPETDLVFLAALLGWTVIALVPRRPLLGAAVAGLLSGVALLLKPHALAWIPAVLFTLVAAAWLERSDRQRRGRLLVATGFFLVGWFCGFVLTWRLTSGGWSFNPADALGLRVYGAIASRSATSAMSLAGALRIAGYAAAHLAVVGVLFGPSLAAAGSVVLRARADGRCGPSAYAALFVPSLLLFLVAMVSQFSASVGAFEPGEAMRLHGRYLGVALVFLPFFHFQFMETASARATRWVSLAGAALVVLFALVVVPRFKIFPWDYPELFAFYASPNHYQWTYDEVPVWLGRLLPALCLACFMAVAARPRWVRPIFTLQLLVVLAAGHLQVQRWLDVHMRGNRETIQVGEALARTLSPAGPGDGLVIGADRYGQLSYLLFALGNSPRVLVKEAGATIVDSDILGAKWVVASRSYDAQFAHRASVNVGEFVLYPLAASSPSVVVREKTAWRGAAFQLRLGMGAGASSSLSGFNVQEDWGAWTSHDLAEVELPHRVSGKIRFKVFGWVLPERIGTPVQFKLGDSTRSLHMTGVGDDYVLEFELHEPTDRLRISFPTSRPAGSPRDMGVAIRDLQLEGR